MDTPPHRDPDLVEILTGTSCLVAARFSLPSPDKALERPVLCRPCGKERLCSRDVDHGLVDKVKRFSALRLAQ
jgi:hypothetical protein